MAQCVLERSAQLRTDRLTSSGNRWGMFDRAPPDVGSGPQERVQPDARERAVGAVEVAVDVEHHVASTSVAGAS
jgi:hypothetical protein